MDGRLKWVAISIVGLLVFGGALWGALTLTNRLLAGKPVAETTSTVGAAVPVSAEAAPAEAAAAAAAPSAPAGGEYVKGNVEQQHLWGLATCGGLTEMNGERHDTLAGFATTPDQVELCKQYLAQWWDVSSRDDLLETLSWIEKEGHRTRFQQMSEALAIASSDQIAQLQAQYQGDAEALNQIDVARQYGPGLGAKSLVGWDYARYVFLCRRGYACGYLSEQEAWDKIMGAARIMQSTFSSWSELADNYSIGRRYWSLAQTQASGTQFDLAQRNLLDNPSSPWGTLPWNLDLTVAAQ